MEITSAHRDFWAYHTGPAWVRDTYRKPPEVPIPMPETDPGFCKSNLLAMLRHTRSSLGTEGVRDWLRATAVSPGTIIRPLTRSAAARKWLKRMEPLWKEQQDG